MIITVQSRFVTTLTRYLTAYPINDLPILHMLHPSTITTSSQVTRPSFLASWLARHCLICQHTHGLISSPASTPQPHPLSTPVRILRVWIPSTTIAGTYLVTNYSVPTLSLLLPCRPGCISIALRTQIGQAHKPCSHPVPRNLPVAVWMSDSHPLHILFLFVHITISWLLRLTSCPPRSSQPSKASSTPPSLSLRPENSSGYIAQEGKHQQGDISPAAHSRHLDWSYVRYYIFHPLRSSYSPWNGGHCPSCPKGTHNSFGQPQCLPSDPVFPPFRPQRPAPIQTLKPADFAASSNTAIEKGKDDPRLTSHGSCRTQVKATENVYTPSKSCV